MSANSPSAAMRQNRCKKNRHHAMNTNLIGITSKKEAINIETNTVTKHINIKWSINKQTIDIAKLSSKGEKKGVIETSVRHKRYTFNLELCVPGWRRSQDGFSAFYLTVPREKRPRRTLPTDNDRIDDDNNALIENQSPRSQHNNNNVNDNSEDVFLSNEDDAPDHDNSDFVARYTVTFGRNHNKLTRKSSVRNDFDLGVGFPNFTEVETLSNAIYGNILEFNIQVEIFECQSKIKNCPYLDNYHIKQTENANGITSKLVEKMYNEKLNCDAAIITNYINKKGIKKRKSIRVHKCILTAASPVIEILFKHKSAENVTSSIIMTEWNINTVLSMIKFIYLGKVELINDDIDDIDDNIDENAPKGLDDDDDDIDDDDQVSEEVKCDQDDDDEEKSTSTSTSDSDTSINSESVDDNNSKISIQLLSEESKNDNELDDKENKDEIMKDLELECPENARALFALFQIAECYEIKELSIACCHELTSYITPQTCCFALLMINKYTHLNDKMKHIKNYILRFMVNNIRMLQKTKGYLYLLQNKPYLLDELITRITEDVRN